MKHLRLKFNKNVPKSEREQIRKDIEQKIIFIVSPSRTILEI